MSNGFAALIRLLPLPVGRRSQPLDPAPLLQPHYRPSSLVQAGPPQYFSIGTLALWLSPLVLLPWHPSPGSRSSAQEPGPGSRPLYAGCRPPSNQVSGALIPEEQIAPGSGSIYTYRRVIEGFAFARLPGPYLPEDRLRTFTPTLTTTAFDRSSLEWFETRSWKLASKGLPSSLTQLVHAQVSFSFRNLLIRALRHTSAFV